jgi:hypothetical protein
MGGSPSMPAPQPLPPAPQPIDYDRMANASIRVAKAQSREQEAPTNWRASWTTNTSPELAVWSVRS